jgi:hypothetical protein
MPARPRLAIITHSADRFRDRATLAGHLIPRWERMGLSVQVVTERDASAPADVALLHVDLSVIPEVCQRMAHCYPRVINGSVLDIRKRRFSRQLVTRGSSGGGPVIVKTDRNHCGWPELEYRARHSSWARMLDRTVGRSTSRVWLARMESMRPWGRTRLLPDYPVYPDAAAVPRGVWRNRELVVERFVCERSGGNYVCRHWLFFGDSEICRRTVSPDAMVKLGGPPVRLHEPVPEALRAIRRELGFDYGKFDFGMVDGEVVLYDTNRTPGANRDSAVHAETLDALAAGLFTLAPELNGALSGSALE